MQMRREMQLRCIAGSPLLHLTTENSVLTHYFIVSMMLKLWLILCLGEYKFGIIKIYQYLHFLSYVNTEVTEDDEILKQGK